MTFRYGDQRGNAFADGLMTGFNFIDGIYARREAQRLARAQEARANEAFQLEKEDRQRRIAEQDRVRKETELARLGNTFIGMSRAANFDENNLDPKALEGIAQRAYALGLPSSGNYLEDLTNYVLSQDPNYATENRQGDIGRESQERYGRLVTGANSRATLADSVMNDEGSGQAGAYQQSEASQPSPAPANDTRSTSRGVRNPQVLAGSAAAAAAPTPVDINAIRDRLAEVNNALDRIAKTTPPVTSYGFGGAGATAAAAATAVLDASLGPGGVRYKTELLRERRDLQAQLNAAETAERKIEQERAEQDQYERARIRFGSSPAGGPTTRSRNRIREREREQTSPPISLPITGIKEQDLINATRSDISLPVTGVSEVAGPVGELFLDQGSTAISDRAMRAQRGRPPVETGDPELALSNRDLRNMRGQRGRPPLSPAPFDLSLAEQDQLYNEAGIRGPFTRGGSRNPPSANVQQRTPPASTTSGRNTTRPISTANAPAIQAASEEKLQLASERVAANDETTNRNLDRRTVTSTVRQSNARTSRSSNRPVKLTPQELEDLAWLETRQKISAVDADRYRRTGSFAPSTLQMLSTADGIYSYDSVTGELVRRTTSSASRVNDARVSQLSEKSSGTVVNLLNQMLPDDRAAWTNLTSYAENKYDDKEKAAAALAGFANAIHNGQLTPWINPMYRFVGDEVMLGMLPTSEQLRLFEAYRQVAESREHWYVRDKDYEDILGQGLFPAGQTPGNLMYQGAEIREAIKQDPKLVQELGELIGDPDLTPEEIDAINPAQIAMMLRALKATADREE